MRQAKYSRNRLRRAGAASLLAVLLAVGGGCVTVVLGKPVPCPAPSEAADAQLASLYESGVLKDQDPLAHDLGEWERYCDYIDSLRGDL
jgi:hypothetical protein